MRKVYTSLVWASWESSLLQLLSTSILEYLSGNWLGCRSSQGLMLSLVVTSESKSPCLRFCQHKGWLTVLDLDLSNGVEESPSGDAFFQ